MSPKSKSDQLFELVGIVDADEVPNWARRPQKYKPILDAIEGLEIGKTVKFRFPNDQAASQARNTIRDYLNRMVATARHEGQQPPIPGMVTTRIAEAEDGGGGVIAYFTMAPTENVIQTSPEKQSPGKGRLHQKR